MPINYDVLEEGDDLNAASVNGRLSTVGGAGQGVNNLSQEDVERRALRQEHLPSIITPSDFPNGLSKRAPITTLASLPYINTLNTLATGAVPVPGYQTFDLGAPNGPYGPPAAAATGWRIVADLNDPAEAAEIGFGPLTASTTSESIGNYRGLLVRLSIGLDAVHPGTSGPWGRQGVAVVIAIGWEDHLGNRSVIERSVRWYNYGNVIKGSLDVFTFIKVEDIGNNNQISKVFGVIASASWGIANPSYHCPIIKYYNIDVLPIRAGGLS